MFSTRSWGRANRSASFKRQCWGGNGHCLSPDNQKDFGLGVSKKKNGRQHTPTRKGIIFEGFRIEELGVLHYNIRGGAQKKNPWREGQGGAGPARGGIPGGTKHVDGRGGTSDLPLRQQIISSKNNNTGLKVKRKTAARGQHSRKRGGRIYALILTDLLKK